MSASDGRCVRHLIGFLLAGVLLLGPLPAQGSLVGNKGGLLCKIDPATGAEQCIPMAGPIPTAQGLTYDGSRLIALRQAALGLMQPFIAVHPADGTIELRGTTGFNWGLGGIDTDPTTGIVYATRIGSLYSIDTAGGHSDEAPRATLIAADIGLLPGDAILALGIDANGVAYGFGVRQAGFSIYRVDLTGGPAVLLGVLQYPAPAMSMTDVAFDENGTLWAYLLHGDPEQGLYRIDLGAQTLTQYTSDSDMYSGLAFVPTGPLVTYCTAKTNSLGCVPAISGDGFPSVTGTSGFTVACRDTRNNTNGLLIWGTRGPQAAPFLGGTLCVAPRLRRTPLVSSGGTPYPAQDCTGVWELDFNSLLSDRQLAFMAGQQVDCQWMGRDGGFAPPDGVSLSNALEFVLGP
jgi:hypothetical protein